ncbi:MAG: hypothetical protein ACRC35_06635 [Angustibacter sp.]
MLIGARPTQPTLTHLEDAERKLGRLEIIRVYHDHDSTPDRFRDKGIPSRIVHWVSFRNLEPKSLRSWAATAPRGTVATYWHEVEGSLSGTGEPNLPSAQFRREFVRFSQAIREGGEGRVKVGMISAGSQYREGGNGYSGAFIVDPVHVDVYGIDSYAQRIEKMLPMEEDLRFQRWLDLIPKGSRIAVTEWGRGLLPAAYQVHARRAELIAADHAYLARTRRAVAFMPFWSVTGSQGNWQFRDQESTAAMRRLPRTNLKGI